MGEREGENSGPTQVWGRHHHRRVSSVECRVCFCQSTPDKGDCIASEGNDGVGAGIIMMVAAASAAAVADSSLSPVFTH